MADERDTGLLRLQAKERARYLLFGVKGTVYGVHVSRVNEIVLLPELKMFAERTGHFIGAVNLRGDIVSVMDLELRFGRKRGRYALQDYLLVLESGDQRVAVIVNQVLGVEQIDLEQHSSTGSTEKDAGANCIENMVSVGEQIVMLLDIKRVLSSPPPAQAAYLDEDSETESTSFAAASEADRAVFRRRADQLRRFSSGLEADELTSLAVAEIAGEFYAFELDFVREFFEVQEVTPVPCCPAKIIGNINLRGDVVTVVDVRGHLNLPVEARVDKGKVIIAKTEEMTVGVLVDSLHGVIYLPVDEVTNVANTANSPDAPIKGTAPFRDTMMSIIDVPRLLALASWLVDEEVGQR